MITITRAGRKIVNFALWTWLKNSSAFTSNISNYLGSPCDICRCLETRPPNFCSSLLHLACHRGTLVLLITLDFSPHVSKILGTDLNHLFFNSGQINVLVRPLSHLMIMSFVMEIPEDVLVRQKEPLSLQTCPSLRGT